MTGGSEAREAGADGGRLGHQPTGFDMFQATGANAQIELVGMHLRVRGTIDIGRFTRLSDRVNHSRGYIRIEDARLLKRNGDPTPLGRRCLYVNQDEVTFIALAHVDRRGHRRGPVGSGRTGR